MLSHPNQCLSSQASHLQLFRPSPISIRIKSLDSCNSSATLPSSAQTLSSTWHCLLGKCHLETDLLSQWAPIRPFQILLLAPLISTIAGQFCLSSMLQTIQNGLASSIAITYPWQVSSHRIQSQCKSGCWYWKSHTWLIGPSNALEHPRLPVEVIVWHLGV